MAKIRVENGLFYVRGDDGSSLPAYPRSFGTREEAERAVAFDEGNPVDEAEIQTRIGFKPTNVNATAGKFPENADPAITTDPGDASIDNAASPLALSDAALDASTGYRSGFVGVDNEDGALDGTNVSFAPDTPDPLPLGTTSVTLYMTDAAGNRAETTNDITVT